MEMEELNWKKNGRMSMMESRYKTEVCRRFMAGTCGLGSKCRYAHGVSELRVRGGGGCPRVCRIFSVYRNCSYGHKCRFLHHHPQPPPPPPAEYTAMQTETTSCTNASSTTLETNGNEQQEPPPQTQRVKFIFKDHQLQKISRIYADWI
ncbi:hypothetical protein PIB30_007557 [Stylosanthes scabra]|uniref:C3H1-type domain-containing protein n=1 Tax=Stylosanthes scabra TaxID=79078 RepID=A0ABU6T4I1_9FABA|nr:hypothetical protein [Stylosanthes scabra]